MLADVAKIVKSWLGIPSKIHLFYVVFVLYFPYFSFGLFISQLYLFFHFPNGDLYDGGVKSGRAQMPRDTLFVVDYLPWASSARACNFGLQKMILLAKPQLF